ncbi:MAG TPA: hypothetical protein VGR07_07430, partial [Thermoanaerobaculia bacterium]|nr:hypothetical protein [Thermoanaerobaculia bacterium]
QHWDPQPVAVEVRRCTFLEHPPFAGERPVLANAFHLQDVPYRWRRGVRESLSPASRRPEVPETAAVAGA